MEYHIIINDRLVTKCRRLSVGNDDPVAPNAINTAPAHAEQCFPSSESHSQVRDVIVHMAADIGCALCLSASPFAIDANNKYHNL